MTNNITFMSSVVRRETNNCALSLTSKRVGCMLAIIDVWLPVPIVVFRQQAVFPFGISFSSIEISLLLQELNLHYQKELMRRMPPMFVT